MLIFSLTSLLFASRDKNNTDFFVINLIIDNTVYWKGNSVTRALINHAYSKIIQGVSAVDYTCFFFPLSNFFSYPHHCNTLHFYVLLFGLHVPSASGVHSDSSNVLKNQLIMRVNFLAYDLVITLPTVLPYLAHIQYFISDDGDDRRITSLKFSVQDAYVL